MRNLHTPESERILSTKYIVEEHEVAQFTLARMFEDCRGCDELEMDQWVQSVEQEFTVPEILSFSSDI